jgi:tetratricopeptide (TPR) repeat protein
MSALLAVTAAFAACGSVQAQPAGPGANAPAAATDGPYAAGIAALRAKNYRAAIEAFGAMTDATPTDLRAWELLGAAYAGQLDWKASRRAYERAVKLAPDDLAAHAGLGLALQALKDPALQTQSDWLKAKAQACADACPDAARLKALAAAGLYSAS